MPKVSGLDVLKTFKADAQLKIIPVLVSSTSRETPDLVECCQHGVNAQEVKPVDCGEFVAAVKQLGIFGAAINSPRPNIGRVQSGQAGVLEKEDDKNGIPAPYPAS
jgi:DNA-binding NarL/FixJ family response regulator